MWGWVEYAGNIKNPVLWTMQTFKAKFHLDVDQKSKIFNTASKILRIYSVSHLSNQLKLENLLVSNLLIPEPQIYHFSSAGDT